MRSEKWKSGENDAQKIGSEVTPLDLLAAAEEEARRIWDDPKWEDELVRDVVSSTGLDPDEVPEIVDLLKRARAHDAFARFFVNWCLLGGRCMCPACGDRQLTFGCFDFFLSEFGPDFMRAGYCFDCGWAVYESGRIEVGSARA